uniref:Integral membrane protein n=1 Tax=Parastrongyloides trichosuri TaxID=131310 RepID=A0A0N5A2D4_PARTI
EAVVDIQHVGHAAGHAGPEVEADRPQHHGDAAGHVFQAVGAAALDHGDGAGVAHPEALAGQAGGEQLAARGTVQHGVADDGVGLGGGQLRGGPDHEGRAGEALADIVVGLAGQLDPQALDGEGAEALAGRALELCLPASASGGLAGLAGRTCGRWPTTRRRPPCAGCCSAGRTVPASGRARGRARRPSAPGRPDCRRWGGGPCRPSGPDGPRRPSSAGG